MRDSHTFFISDLRGVDETLSTWRAGTILSCEELARVNGFAAPGPARTFIAGRLVLRGLVAKMAGCRPEDVMFHLEAGGKPRVEHPRGIEVNLTHSDGWILAATASLPVGIDMEAVRPMDWPIIARRFLSPADRHWLEAYPVEDRQRAFFHLWTWKESVAKAVGAGLGLLPELPPPCVCVQVAGQRLHVTPVELPSPLIAHLAVIVP